MFKEEMRHPDGRSPEPEVTVILPTYNERGNLPVIVPRLARALERTGLSHEILVVDDRSPDGTPKIAEELGCQYPVRVLVRGGPRGLGPAVNDGFRNARGWILGVMDADLQHPPELVSDMVYEVSNGTDIAIASRWSSGGGARGWGIGRRLVSRGAEAVARLLLPEIRGLRDPMSGFFFLKRKVLEGVSISPCGFKVLLDVMVRGRYKRVVEVPYLFGARVWGRSHLTIRQYLDFVSHTVRLARERGGTAARPGRA